MTDISKHLECVLSSHRMSKEETLLNKHIAKKNQVKESLEEKFGSNIHSPFNSGSYAKNTAVNSKFDFDLMSPFKRNAFGTTGTLKDMYDNVHDFLLEKYKGEATVRKQKVSIGLEFFADADGHVIKIDVVPGRELNQDQYTKDSKLNLYVNEQFGKISQGSDYIRSNIQAQIDNIRDRATAEKDSVRKIVRLLKIWKIGRGHGPKSFFLELVVLKAFDNVKVTGDLWEKVKIVLEYIRENVILSTFNLPDPGNSGNNVADTLTDSDKTALSEDFKNMIDRISENSDHITSYFRINEKHPCDENPGGNKYGIKKEVASVPPVSRFGRHE